MKGRPKRVKWTADLSRIPGLKADLDKILIQTGAFDHAELLARLTFAHRNVDTMDLFWKLTLKPDAKCNKKEILAKRIIQKLYKFAGVGTQELAELIIDQLEEMAPEFDGKEGEAISS